VRAAMVRKRTALVMLASAALAAVPHTAFSQSAAAGCRADVARYEVELPAHPFKAVQSPDGRYVFVTLLSASPTSPNGVAVLRCDGGRYRFSHVVPFEPGPTGLALTHDGRLLLAADDAYVVFIDAPAAVSTAPKAPVFVQEAAGDPDDQSPSAIYTAITADDATAFVSDETNQTITVYDLRKARAAGFTRDAIVGTVPVARAPIGLAFSPDGRYLYTTSQVATRDFGWPVICKREGAPADAPAQNGAGAIITIDVAKARTNPATAVVSRVASDCNTVRLALSPDGTVLWASNRGSDTVTAFSTAKLVAAAPDARIATIKVGSNPVGIATTPDGRYVLVGNTNRFGPGGTTTGSLSVIDAQAMRVVGSVPAGRFPREFTPGSQSAIFLANYGSNSVTVFDGTRIGELIR
jgi:DNA-binding beta-propeller fold protein YncE